MSQSEARAWWADVQHVRESIERRRADDRRAEAGSRRRSQQYEPRWDDADWADELLEPRRRFVRDEAPSEELAADGSLEPGADVPDGPRRTVQITGRTVPAPALRLPAQGGRRRRSRRPAERVGHRPDRIALWAVALALFLILVAATSSSRAATPAQADAPALVAHVDGR